MTNTGTPYMPRRWQPSRANRFTNFAQVLDVVVAVFSVIVFAALAGMLGAYFLEAEPSREQSDKSTSLRPGVGERSPHPETDNRYRT